MIDLRVFLIIFLLFIGISGCAIEDGASINTIVASSTLKHKNDIYNTDNLFDGDSGTCWVEGVPGSGIGETITFNFKKMEYIKEFYICNGFQIKGLYYKNNRVKSLRINDRLIQVEDTGINKYQVVKLARGILTKALTMSIDSVYPGTHWDDTCISELRFYEWSIQSAIDTRVESIKHKKQNTEVFRQLVQTNSWINGEWSSRGYSPPDDMYKINNEEYFGDYNLKIKTDGENIQVEMQIFIYGSKNASATGHNSSPIFSGVGTRVYNAEMLFLEMDWDENNKYTRLPFLQAIAIDNDREKFISEHTGSAFYKIDE